MTLGFTTANCGGIAKPDWKGFCKVVPKYPSRSNSGGLKNIAEFTSNMPLS